MNFLSHYYFERFHREPELVLGSIFPDLLKIAEPKLHIHPYRHELLLINNPKLKNLYLGWQRHLEVDRYFHGVSFFYDHVHEIKATIQHVLAGTDVRASFMAHISLELMLDHLLIVNKIVDPQVFYQQLEQVDLDAVKRFLKACGVDDASRFLKFYQEFLASKYVYSYKETSSLAQALIQICKRIWVFELDPEKISMLEKSLQSYLLLLNKDFKKIFDEIEAELW